MFSKGLLIGLLMAPGLACAGVSVANCWAEPNNGLRIDVDGQGDISGALSLPESLLSQRLERVRGPVDLLVNGYDVLKVQRLCQQITTVNAPLAKVVFGGRERYLAQSGAPAWDWLMVTSNDVAANLVMEQLPGIFVGKGKAVVGRGLQASAITDPAKMAAWLMDTYQGKQQPVVLFVDSAYQQPFLEFFSASPMPGVFLSFENPESVRDALNKHAKFSTDDQARLLNYYCK
ncbi:hypothetical protein ACVW0Y_004674 [Pseudomonas sp. TE3786]